MTAAMGKLNIGRKHCDRTSSCTKNPNRVYLNQTFYNVKVKAKQSLYWPGQALRVPGG
jgi:hypothetical protein